MVFAALKATVNKKFSNGGSVLKAMKDMVQEQKGPEDASPGFRTGFVL